MASALAEATITAKQRLMQIITATVATQWGALPHYDREQVDQFLASVIPVTAIANRQAVLLTEAFLTRALGQAPVGLDAAQIVAGIRNGATPAEVYQRPFVTVWTALKNGAPWAEAVKMGLDRATGAAVTDVQLSYTHTLRAAGQQYGDRIMGYQRVPDATACDFCRAAAGLLYHSSDLLPLHRGCGCGVDVVTSGDMPAGSSFAHGRFGGAGGLQVAVHNHGELGPVLTNANDHFTGPAAIAAH